MPGKAAPQSGLGCSPPCGMDTGFHAGMMGDVLGRHALKNLRHSYRDAGIQKPGMAAPCSGLGCSPPCGVDTGFPAGMTGSDEATLLLNPPSFPHPVWNDGGGDNLPYTNLPLFPPKQRHLQFPTGM